MKNKLVDNLPLFYGFKSFIKYKKFYIGINFNKWVMSYDENDIYQIVKIIDEDSKDELLKIKDYLQEIYNKFIDFKDLELFNRENFAEDLNIYNKDLLTDINILNKIEELNKFNLDPYFVLLSIAARRLSVIKGEKLLDVENI